jgi:hypothetical protein
MISPPLIGKAGSVSARGLQKESSGLVLDRESMAGMGLVSRAYDKLPDWAKIVLGICGIAAIVYGLATEGPIFLLKALLKPVP